MKLFGRRRAKGLPEATRGSFAQLVSYMAGAWHLLAGLLFCIIINSLLELAIPSVMGFMLFDRVIKNANLSLLPIVAAALIAIFVLQKLFTFLQEYLYEFANQRVIHRLRCDLFEHIERLPLGYFERGQTGELLSRITGDVDTVENLLDTFVKDIAAEAVMFAGALIFLFQVNPGLTLYVLPTLPLLALSVVFFKRTVKSYARRVRNLIGEMAALAGETIAGVRVVKAFTGERYEAVRFAAKSNDLLQARVRTAKLRAVYSSTVDVWVLAGTLVVVIIAAPRVVAGTFTVGALVAYLSYLNKLYGPAKKLSKVNFGVQKILAAADRIFEVMYEPIEGGGALQGQTVRKGEGSKEVFTSPVELNQGFSTPSAFTHRAPPSRGAVEFRHVGFAYDEGGRPALRDFSLKVAPGEMVALVGKSGGGKTTAINLLLRFYEPTSGCICLDGVPITDLPLETLRREIGLVQQETFLFSGSIRDNIAYARPEATDAEIVAAARAAYADDFITNLRHGYLTEVGERGAKLSGGQRQRLAIARALLRDPRILIFDEATSHLDSESEYLVQQALERVSEGRTVFAIAHRLSTVWRADKIIVIEGGEIVQVGRHNELLADEGTYRRLYDLQLNAPGAVSRR